MEYQVMEQAQGKEQFSGISLQIIIEKTNNPVNQRIRSHVHIDPLLPEKGNIIVKRQGMLEQMFNTMSVLFGYG